MSSKDVRKARMNNNYNFFNYLHTMKVSWKYNDDDLCEFTRCVEETIVMCEIFICLVLF